MSAQRGSEAARARLIKRAEVLALLRAGHSLRETARLTGLSASTIRRVANRRAQHAKAGGVERERGAGRPPKAEPFRDFAAERLQEDPALSSQEILRQARARGYSGGKTAMYALVARLRQVMAPSAQEPVQVPGAVTQHEVGWVRVRLPGGRSTRLSFLVSRLEFSRWLEVSLLHAFDVESLLRALVEHFDRMGGVPLSATLRVPKRLGLQSAGVVGTGWHPAFAQAVLDLGVGIAIRPLRDRTGMREPLARWVKKRFFERRRFVSARDLYAQLAKWLVDVNTKIPSRSTRAIPARRMDQERGGLRSLRIDPHDFALRIPVVVGPKSSVEYEGARYRAPPATAHQQATIYLQRARLRVVVGDRFVEHERRGPHPPPPVGRNGSSERRNGSSERRNGSSERRNGSSERR